MPTNSIFYYREFPPAIGLFWDFEVCPSRGTPQTRVPHLLLQTQSGNPTNGAEDICWIPEGKDYPRLWWELIPEN